ncbi:MAG: formate dehydrogenase accessory sulfurtransferase FdhD [Pyrinomonadaceae bacterium]|nr:formate dehydrogenase accessory sulfurtransferase FdhD [Pyrinomonadaceae bacterium]MCX7640593.1 formate dehydrogenase accessory sulfurtransferase FdhD [Pyrinomonadaceae bacterium]MDW8303826.1 formate dehydrogenase accessory sulfurtransferase FdhD [Acidobacteriota bacterium]
MPKAKTSERFFEANIYSIFANGEEKPFKDVLAVEEPLEIRLSFWEGNKPVNQTISITMRTPGEDVELALGFLFSEGILESRYEIASVRNCSANTVKVDLNDNVKILLKNLRRFYTNSSCGLCGKPSLEALDLTGIEKLKNGYPKLNLEIIYSLSERLTRAQAGFNRTGGLHAAALFDTNGNLLRLKEDVGRHNAVDKLIGSYFLEGILPLDDKILFLSGRASFELIQKALRARIPIVCAVGAPSSLAVKTAEKFGLTLFGFVRENRFNLYTDSDRLRK